MAVEEKIIIPRHGVYRTLFFFLNVEGGWLGAKYQFCKTVKAKSKDQARERLDAFAKKSRIIKRVAAIREGDDDLYVLYDGKPKPSKDDVRAKASGPKHAFRE